MTDRKRIARVGSAARAIALESERFLGKMSREQHARTVGLLMGFWCAEEDMAHPRADGRSWRDVAKEELER